MAETRRWLDFLGIPQTLRRSIIVFVVVIALVAFVYFVWAPIRPMFAWTYHQVPFIAKINRIDEQLNDPKSGLSAIATNVGRSQIQLTK